MWYYIAFILLDEYDNDDESLQNNYACESTNHIDIYIDRNILDSDRDWDLESIKFLNCYYNANFNCLNKNGTQKNANAVHQ